MKIKSVICLILIIFISVSTDFSGFAVTQSVEVKLKPLSLEQAISETLKTDKELQNTFDKLTSKRLETQTIKAQIEKQVNDGHMTIKQMREADLEKDVPMHSLIESYAVVQSIDYEIAALEMDVSKRTMDLRTAVRQSYIEICAQEAANAYFTNRIGVLEPKLALLSAKYLLGNVSRDDVAKVKDELIEAKESELRAKTLGEIQREALAKLMGAEQLDQYILSYKPAPYRFDQKKLELAHQMAYESNLDLRKAILEGDYAKRDLEELFEMAKLQYGNAVVGLISLANKTPVDYKLYFTEYAQLLNRPKKYAYEQYPLRLGIYRYDENIGLLKTSFKALEYTQKERYPIQYAVNARDIRQTVILSVKKQMEVVYGKVQSELMRMSDETIKKQDELKAEVAVSEGLKKKNLLGKVSYETVVQNQENIERLNYEINQLALSIEKELAELDQLTSGNLTKSSALDHRPEEIKTPTWYIGPSSNRFGLAVQVKLPSKVIVGQYRLLDFKGAPLSELTDVNQEIFLMPLSGGEDSTCILEFYNGGKVVKRIKINALLPKGSFEW